MEPKVFISSQVIVSLPLGVKLSSTMNQVCFTTLAVKHMFYWRSFGDNAKTIGEAKTKTLSPTSAIAQTLLHRA